MKHFELGQMHKVDLNDPTRLTSDGDSTGWRP